jgi:hypothetical protein
VEMRWEGGGEGVVVGGGEAVVGCVVGMSACACGRRIDALCVGVSVSDMLCIPICCVSVYRYPIPVCCVFRYAVYRCMVYRYRHARHLSAYFTLCITQQCGKGI